MSPTPIFTALFRQTDAVSSIEFSTNNTTWKAITSWPFIIGNSLQNNSILKVKFTTDITLPNGVTDYFLLVENNIMIDGNNKTIKVNNVPNFPGLITNGTETVNGYNNITVKNVVIASTGTTNLLSGQGWICKSYFGKGSTGNIIQNCSSRGPIPKNSGGITGQYTANGSSSFTITGCSASGDILDGADGADAGGIVGPNSGPFTISTCTYSGNGNGNGSGGIIGASTSSVSISYCSSSGIIKGGGIAGDKVGITGKVAITYCFSKGDIGSTVNTKDASFAGGIVGAYSGIVDVTNCYSIGAIGGNGKNDCGGIVGGYAAGGSGQGVVVIQSCFSLGNIYTKCGGIAAKYFGYKSYQTCNIFDCYSLGDIGDNAGGIAGPEWGAEVTLGRCYISSCYSLGALPYKSSGGIIAPSTVTYPTDKFTVKISKCFNSFSSDTVVNSIVGLGYNGVVADAKVSSLLGSTYSTIPTKQIVISDKTTTYIIVDQLSYDIVPSEESLDKARASKYSYYQSKSSTNSQVILKLVSGYYTITPDIIKKISFNKLNLLGFTVSDFLQKAGFTPNDLITYNIYLNSTVTYFKEGIGLSNLFASNYSLPLLVKIGYTVTDVLSVNPGISFKVLIDAGFNFKKNIPPYTIDDLIASSVDPPLSSADIIKAGFSVKDVKALPNDPRFTLVSMRDAGVSVNFLLGVDGYQWPQLKAAGFNVEAFRLAGNTPHVVKNTYQFSVNEFQGSKYPLSSFSSTSNNANRTITWLFTADELVSIGLSIDEIVAKGIYATGTFVNETPIETYIRKNISVKYIPKTINIRDIDYYINKYNFINYDFSKIKHKPSDFLNNGWTKREVAKMGFTVRQLLHEDKLFNLSDLKTVGYTDTQMRDSLHLKATTQNITDATVFTKQNPLVIEKIITYTDKMYVYFNNTMNNTAPDPILIGYSLDVEGEDFEFVPYVKSPLIIQNVDFTTDKYFHTLTYNGKYSILNSCTTARKKEPVIIKIKPNGLKLGFGIAKVLFAAALVSTGLDSLTGFSVSTAIGESGLNDIIDGSNVKITNKGVAANTKWILSGWSYFPNVIKKINGEFFDDFTKAPSKIAELFIGKNSKYSQVVTKPEILGQNYALTYNNVFLFSTLTITEIDSRNDECTVYFTDSIKYTEDIDDIYYTFDNGISWSSSGTKTSPIVIKVEIPLNNIVSISIRYYTKTNVPKSDPDDSKDYITFAMNSVFSEPGEATVSYPIENGRFGTPSSTLSVNMLYSPLVPLIVHVYYNPTVSSVATCYIHQQLNCAGNICDYEWSKDNGASWNPANLNLLEPLPEMTRAELGITETTTASNGTKVQLYTVREPIRLFNINVSNNNGSKPPNVSISIRAVLKNGITSGSNMKYKGLSGDNDREFGPYTATTTVISNLLKTVDSRALL